MENSANRIRREITRLVPHRTTQRIPQSIRQEAIEYVIAERQRGRCWEDLSRSIGICETTIRRWLSKDERTGIAERGELLPVGLRPEPIDTTDIVSTRKDKAKLTIETPKGFRLQGFSLDEAVYLLRELS